LTSPTSEQAPSPEELSALIRLLDDETPEVRQRVSERLISNGGDISEFLSSSMITLSTQDKATLSHILHQARHITIERDWLVPSGGANALREDWEEFEALLRVLSDFLHDGISCRQPLSDALDLLAEEAESLEITDPRALAHFLFASGQLRGNQEHYDDPRNSDLAWCIAAGKSNPIGLCVIYTLVARRLDLNVEAINFPGHFLCRIHEDGYPMIVDCFHHGETHPQAQLMNDPGISRAARVALREVADPGSILVRMLNNLEAALQKADRIQDARLIRHLRESLA
jgi:hypothetical protein